VPADEPVEALAGEPEPYDEAMLERVALEMAAPDFDDADAEFATSVSEVDIAELPQAEFVEPPLVQMAEPPRESAPEPVVAEEPAVAAPPVAPEAAPSLGATILANGLVTRPKIPANDPLAPIRRMTQAEKIAFFS